MKIENNIHHGDYIDPIGMLRHEDTQCQAINDDGHVRKR